MITMAASSSPSLVGVPLVDLDVPQRTFACVAGGPALRRQAFGAERHPPAASAAERYRLTAEGGLQDCVPVVVIDHCIVHATAPLDLSSMRELSGRRKGTAARAVPSACTLHPIINAS